MQYKHATMLLLLVVIGTGILTVAVFQRRIAIHEQSETITGDESGVDSESQRFVSELMNAQLRDGEYRAADVDLDGDGTPEHVEIFVSADEAMGILTEISVNDQRTVLANGSNPAGYFGVVDLNVADAFKEIAVSDYGPSSDNTTAFYGWHNGKMVYLNTTPDLWQNMVFNGDGTFEATTRAGLLDTWFYRGVYAVSGGTIVAVPQDFYAREAISGTEVTALKKVTFQTSPTDSTVSMALEAGEKANVLGCDHIQNEETAIAWCSIADEAVPPNVGWFKVADFLMDGFSGFSFAD